MCYTEPFFVLLRQQSQFQVFRNSASCLSVSELVWCLLCYSCFTLGAFDRPNVAFARIKPPTITSYNRLKTIFLLFCLLKIPAWPCTVQPHLEPEDKGGAAGCSGGGDARLQRGPWARQCHRHLLEPPRVWGLCSAGLSHSNQHIVILLWVLQGNTGLFLKLIQICLYMFLFAGEIWVPFRWDKDRGLLPASAAWGGWKWWIKCHQEIVRLQYNNPTNCTNVIICDWIQKDDSCFSLFSLLDMSSSMNSTIVFCLHPKFRWSACACRHSL